MTYRLVYTQRAIKDIQKLEHLVKSRIGKALLRFEADPLSHAKGLTNAEFGTYRFRIGDYRVIFDLVGDVNSRFEGWAQKGHLQGIRFVGRMSENQT